MGRSARQDELVESEKDVGGELGLALDIKLKLNS